MAVIRPLNFQTSRRTFCERCGAVGFGTLEYSCKMKSQGAIQVYALICQRCANHLARRMLKLSPPGSLFPALGESRLSLRSEQQAAGQ